MKVESRTSYQWHHLLDVDDLSPGDVEFVFQTTDAMKEILHREIKKAPTLQGKVVALLFCEPSTRTRFSFDIAAKRLSANIISSGATDSSISKGESFLHTIHNLALMGADIIVIRHPCSGAPCLAAQSSSVSIINAGDGCHAHPTQALLDLYTIRETRRKIEGLKVVIVGDILHSRVAHSDARGLSLLGADVVLCGPPTLLPPEWELPPRISLEFDLDAALRGADVVVMLRLQQERYQAQLLPSLSEYILLYQLNKERLKLAKPEVMVMHPGPLNEGIEVSHDVAFGPASVISEQVVNGVAVRMALLYLMSRRR
jgi:aspartate carbamoyltransferase catalytic subunit